MNLAGANPGEYYTQDSFRISAFFSSLMYQNIILLLPKPFLSWRAPLFIMHQPEIWMESLNQFRKDLMDFWTSG